MKDWFKARNIWGAAIMTLSDEEAGRFAKALWKYTMTGEQAELDGAEKGLMAIATMMLANDDEQSANLSAVRAEAGAKGARQKVANQANANFAKTDEANEAIAPNKNKNKNKEKDIEKEHKNILAHLDEKFDRFWSAYPRKTAKPDAKKAFVKLNPDEELLQTMLNAIERQKQTSQWQEVQYIPYPASWIRQTRWEDEVPQGKVSPIKPVVAQDYEQREYSDTVYTSPEDMIKRLNEQMGITG